MAGPTTAVDVVIASGGHRQTTSALDSIIVHRGKTFWKMAWHPMHPSIQAGSPESGMDGI